MTPHNLVDISTKLPALGQDAPAETMRNAERPLFRFMDGNIFRAGQFQGSFEFVRHYPEVHDQAEIMQQSSQVCLVGRAEAYRLGKLAAQQRATERVFPKH